MIILVKVNWDLVVSKNFIRELDITEVRSDGEFRRQLNRLFRISNPVLVCFLCRLINLNVWCYTWIFDCENDGEFNFLCTNNNFVVISVNSWCKAILVVIAIKAPIS